MKALFALLPEGQELEPLLAELPAASRARVRLLTLRRYPRADDARHLRSLVRAGRDPLATTWWRGAALAVAAGATLGGAVNGTLAAAFGMLGGLVELALPLGVVLGAFLGGFTAAMTGTEAPRAELQPLWPRVRPGDRLLQWSGADGDALRWLAEQLASRQLALASVRGT